MKKLTLKQKKFADEYIISGNATQSYINAGYSAKTRKVAEANARKLLGNYSVKSYINEKMKQLESEKIASQEEVLQFLTSVMRGDIKEETLASNGDVQEIIKIEVNTRDRIKAGELLGKRYGSWTDKLNIEANISTNKLDDLIKELKDE